MIFEDASVLRWTNTKPCQLPLMFQITDSAIKLCGSCWKWAAKHSKMAPEMCVKAPPPAAALFCEAAGRLSGGQCSGAPAAPSGQEIICCTKSFPPAPSRSRERQRSLQETRQLYFHYSSY